MKFKIIPFLLLAATAVTSHAHAQDVTIVSTNGDDGKHASVYAGLFGPEGVNVVGASFYKPKAVYLNVLAGPTGGMLDGSFLFTSKTKATRLKQTIRSGSVTKFVIDEPMQKRISVGLHAGTSYVDYSFISKNQPGNYSAQGVFGGLTFLSSRHAHWKENSSGKQVQGTSIGRVNADVIYYTNRKLNDTKDSKEQLTIDDVSRTVGFRIYFDGKTSVWSSKGRTAIHYSVGVGQNSDRKRTIAPFVGFGLGYNL